jgi:hypothetical protein
MRTRRARARAGAIALAAAAAALAGLASAAAARAGLTDVQATKLQREVNHVLHHSAPGARQISPNAVEWPRAGATLTLAVPGRARAAGLASCPKRYACLWQDVGYSSRRVQFFHYRTYNLRAYGMPPFDHRGASSYYNHQTGGAKAILHADFDFSMRGHGNLYGALNDRGRSVTLTP